jgi:hypothetical protein
MLRGRPLSERGPPLFIPVPYGLTLVEGWVLPLLPVPSFPLSHYLNDHDVRHAIVNRRSSKTESRCNRLRQHRYNLLENLLENLQFRHIESFYVFFWFGATPPLSSSQSFLSQTFSLHFWDHPSCYCLSLFLFFPLARSLPGQVTTQFTSLCVNITSWVCLCMLPLCLMFDYTTEDRYWIDQENVCSWTGVQMNGHSLHGVKHCLERIPRCLSDGTDLFALEKTITKNRLVLEFGRGASSILPSRISFFRVKPCKSPSWFLGSTDCLNILPLVRLPVYRAARTSHRTWDMNTHSPLSVYHLSLFRPYSSTSRPPSIHES